jgi:hypothetical protein
MEVRREVKTYIIEYECPECKEGNLYPTGRVLLSSPPQYPHKCNKCGYKETFRGIKYPKTETE